MHSKSRSCSERWTSLCHAAMLQLLHRLPNLLWVAGVDVLNGVKQCPYFRDHPTRVVHHHWQQHNSSSCKKVSGRLSGLRFSMMFTCVQHVLSSVLIRSVRRQCLLRSNKERPGNENHCDSSIMSSGVNIFKDTLGARPGLIVEDQTAHEISCNRVICADHVSVSLSITGPCPLPFAPCTTCTFTNHQITGLS